MMNALHPKPVIKKSRGEGYFANQWEVHFGKDWMPADSWEHALSKVASLYRFYRFYLGNESL